ncbi:hypothetical protein ACLOJK_027063 [Asimina triloba]
MLVLGSVILKTSAMVDNLDSPIRQSCWRASRSWLDVICRWVLDLPQINFVAADRSMVMIADPPCLVGRADHRLGLGFGVAVQVARCLCRCCQVDRNGSPA